MTCVYNQESYFKFAHIADMYCCKFKYFRAEYNKRLEDEWKNIFHYYNCGINEKFNFFGHPGGILMALPVAIIKDEIWLVKIFWSKIFL